MPAVELLYQSALESPAPDVAVINARHHPLLATLCRQTRSYALRQHFKPDYNALSTMGLSTGQWERDFDLILVIPSKNKLQTLGWMAEAMQRLNHRGRLIMAVANRHGARSYETALQQLAGNIASTSRAKCRIFSAIKTSALNESLASEWIMEAKPRRLESHGLISQPGLFSWDRPDPGSQLLLRHLPEKLTGVGMDLCCGYGLLTAHILESKPGVTCLHLVDADRLALACSEQNTAAWHQTVRMHWLDAAHEPLPVKMAWIVCNPPFHSGQERDVELGQTIVGRACSSLKPRGRLYLVANRKLPYEQVLGRQLTQHRILAESDGFKVFEGVK